MSSGSYEELGGKPAKIKSSQSFATGKLPILADDDDDDLPAEIAATKLIRTLSLNYEEEASQINAAPSPMSRSNFRKRRLTYAKRGHKIASQEMREKTVFSAGEIGEDPTITPPFPAEICGTYSCHGIEVRDVFQLLPVII